MKTLYLHIGTPKTATSSLQNFLNVNQNVLQSYNYSYQIFPFSYRKINKRRNAHFLSGPGLNENLTSEENRQYQERLNSGLDLVKKQFETYENVILTDEHLWFALNYSQWDPLQILIDHSKANDYQIKVIVYLRRQDQFVISRWKQFVKKSNSQNSLESQIKKDLKYHPLILYYGQALDKISTKIGKENLIVRRFEPSSWPEGSVYLDFQDTLNLPGDIQLKFPKEEENPSLKNNFLELKLMVNNNKFLNDNQKDLFSKYIKQASNNREEHNEYGILSSDETRQFLSLFEDENAYVAEEYIKDGRPLFSTTVKEVKKWVPTNEYILDDLDAFLTLMPDEMVKLYYSATILDLQRNSLDLQNKYKDLKEQVSAHECTIQKLRSLAHPIQTLTGRNSVAKKK